jgi:hypothetical protein
MSSVKKKDETNRGERVKDSWRRGKEREKRTGKKIKIKKKVDGQRTKRTEVEESRK